MPKPLPLLLSLLLLCLAGAEARAQVAGSPECKRQLFFAEPSVKQARDRLKDGANGTGAERCRLWRDYAAALKGARPVFARCLAEPARGRRLAELGTAAAEMDGAVASQCAGEGKGQGKGNGAAGGAGRSFGGTERLTPSQ